MRDGVTQCILFLVSELPSLHTPRLINIFLLLAGLDLKTYLEGKEGHYKEMVTRAAGRMQPEDFNPNYRKLAAELRAKNPGMPKVRPCDHKPLWIVH